MRIWSSLRSLFSSSADCTSSECLWKDAHLTQKDMETLRTLDHKIVVGYVLDVAPHPDEKITKVQVTQVSFGDGNTVQILCGGTNVAEGQIVAVATVGAQLSEDFEIGVRPIRGVDSHGMICARSELGLSSHTEKKGEIWVLPEALGDFLGRPIAII